MSQIISELWNGNITPCEHCGANDVEANHLISLMERHRETLSRDLAPAQMDVFQKYMDCADEYLLRMLELAFCDGFCLGGKLVSGALV